jgi:hypothetical protein
MDGWIKIHRQLEDWEWYTNIPVKTLFIHCLLKANHKDNQWQGIVIKKGSFVTSYENLSIETGLTVRQIRTALNKLKMTGEVTHKGQSRYSIITINNWNLYQDNDKQNDKQMTNERQTNDKQTTTNNNDKNDKNEKNDKNTYLDSYITREKKIDPFINPIKTFFQEQYTQIMGKSPRLSLIECNRLTELASENNDIKEIIPEAIRKLKNLKFEGIKFTPSASWLLKGNNFERLLNGEFEAPESEYERLKRKFGSG